MKQRVFLGMLPRRHPSNLPENTAQQALDVDLSRGTIAPLRTDALLDATAPAGQVWLSPDGCRTGFACDASIVENTVGCNGAVFATGVAPYPVRATRANWQVNYLTRLGLPCPPTAPDVAWAPIEFTDQGAMPRAFFYAYANEDTGEVGVGSPPSPTTIVNWDTQAVLGGFAAPPAEYRVTHIVIFMLQPGVENMTGTPAGSEAGWFEIGRIPVSTTTFTYTSERRLGRMFMGFEYGEPPVDLRDLTAWGTNVLAGLSGDHLVFSEPGVFGAWPDKYRLRFHAKPLRFLAGQTYGYVLTDGVPEVITLKHDCSRGGCREITTLEEELPLVGMRAAAVAEGACFFASRQGIVMMSGPRARLITEGLWTQEQWEALAPHAMTFIVHNGFLYGSTSAYAFRFRVPSSIHEPPSLSDFTELSLRASSWYRRGAELYYVGATGGLYHWQRGDSVKPYVYHTRQVSLPGDVAPAVLRVSAESVGVEAQVVLGGVSYYTGEVIPNRPMPLKRGGRGDTVEVVLTGTATITELQLAPSIQDLAR